jgi:hypothetical protein
VAALHTRHPQYRYCLQDAAEQDEKGIVTLPPNIAASFDNGFAIADIIRKVTVSNGQESPPSLANIKADASRSAKLTNWNFIWYFCDDSGLP